VWRSVKVHVSSGLPGFTIVGLPDAAVREARDRVRAAVLQADCCGPRKVTVNAAPTARYGTEHRTDAESQGSA
jgi:magnesium chelatase family protein